MSTYKQARTILSISDLKDSKDIRHLLITHYSAQGLYLYPEIAKKMAQDIDIPTASSVISLLLKSLNSRALSILRESLGYVSLESNNEQPANELGANHTNPMGNAINDQGNNEGLRAKI